MSFRTWPIVLATLSLAACGGGETDTDGDGITDEEETAQGLDPESADSDDDGLKDGDEAAAGADPLMADTDGDGLLDGEEVDGGTDPALGDTDGDTYLDFDELAEGKDPLDPESRIYTGYWPYNRYKEDMKQNAIEGDSMKPNKQFGRYKGRDQYGEVVDLYDFANQVYVDDAGVEHPIPVIFDLSGEWCYWCNELAGYLDGNDDIGGYEDETGCWKETRKAINNGQVYWFTVLDLDAQGLPATDETTARWASDYPKDQIPVVSDPDMVLADYMDVYGYPTVVVLNSDLTVEDASGDWTSAFDTTCSLIAE